ncbi:MAG: hypothetical protein BIFFINMI_01867 [Phycisphaerae bacterium]|nr:hypothetical protein [Phycisphaerae bacterium]
MRRRFLIAATLLSACLAAAGCQKGFIIRPYLQRPGQTEMSILWTASDPRDAQVRCGTGQTLDITPESYRCVRRDALHDEYVCRATLGGLKPGTTYRYRVTCGPDREEGTFTTFPAGPSPEFSFVIYGDTRSNPEEHHKLAEAIAADRPLFGIHSGDLVRGGAFSEFKGDYFDPAASLIRDVPVMVARGNHEEGGQALRRLFVSPGPRPDALYYSFDCGNVHVVALDSQGARGSRAYAAGMLDWLDQDLAASKADWKVVFYHHPTYDLGIYQTRWGHEDFAPAFRRGGVDLSASGHTHGYQRFHPMFAPGENDRRPITYIVSAGGGAPLYRIATSPFAAIASPVYHYTLVKVRGRTMEIEARTADGRVLDSFTLDKSAGGYGPQLLASARDERGFDAIRDRLVPDLRVAAMLPHRPTSRTAVAHSFELSSPVDGEAMHYELGFEPRSAQKYRLVEPVSGDVPAGGRVTVKFTIQAKNTSVRISGRHRLDPDCLLLLRYRIGREEGTVFSPLAGVYSDADRERAAEEAEAAREADDDQ